MSWLPIIALAVAVFLIAAFALRLPKTGWTLFGAGLLFGLTGYALQGSPGYAGAPKQAEVIASEANFALIDARRAFYDPESVPSRFVTVADGFARQGQFDDAANILGNAVSENPQDAEAWLAMGNALIEHAQGVMTPSALYAYSQAERLQPNNPAAGYFLGIAMLRNGRPADTRAIWTGLLENAPPNAPWREDLQLRLDRLDQMLGQISAHEAP